MEHIEIHVMKNPHDVELAVIAGLIDEFEDTVELACGLCDQLIHFTENAAAGFIVLSEDTEIISCEACLTSSVGSVMVT